MDALSLLPATPGVGSRSSSSNALRGDEAKVRDSASQFEALLVAQMLKNARESSVQGSEAESGDQAGTSLMEMAEESMAQALTSRGGLGIASMIMKQLRLASPNVSEIPADKVQRTE